MGVIMGTTVHVLWSGEYQDRCAVGVFELPEDAQEWVGRETMAGRPPAQPLELEAFELIATAAPEQPDVDPVGAAIRATPREAPGIGADDLAPPWPADARHANAAGLNRMARELRVLDGGGMALWSEYSTADRALYLSSARRLLNAYAGRLPSPTKPQVERALNAYAGRLPSPTKTQAERALVTYENTMDGLWGDLDEDVRQDYLAQARANWS
jgi:hypothetical protein